MFIKDKDLHTLDLLVKEYGMAEILQQMMNYVDPMGHDAEALILFPLMKAASDTANYIVVKEGREIKVIDWNKMGSGEMGEES